MNLLKTAAIASSLVAASFVMGAGMAKAQNAVVPFNGTVGSVCEFGAIVNGTLIVDPVDANTLTSTGATAGTTTLSCNSDVIVSVVAPAAVGAPATGLTITASTATVGVEGETATVGTDTPTITGPLTNSPVTVNMTATANAPIPAALLPYVFNVTVTAAPQ